MFKSKEKVTRMVIELDEETKQHLAALEADLQTLNSLNREVVLRGQAILGAITGEIAAQTPVAEPEDLNGVQVFADEAPRRPYKDRPLKETKSKGDPESVASDAERARIRSAPFTRRPRSEQVTWLRGILQDGEWHNAHQIARDWGTEPRHIRYLKSAVGGRMRELWEDGELDRRDAHIPGVIYEYRLKGGAK